MVCAIKSTMKSAFNKIFFEIQDVYYYFQKKFFLDLRKYFLI